MSDPILDTSQTFLGRTNVGTAILASIITSIVIVGGIIWSDASNKTQTINNTAEIQKLRDTTVTKDEFKQIVSGQTRIENKVDELNRYLLTQEAKRQK